VSALTLGRDAGGPRWYLDGQPIHCSDGLELRTLQGTWVPVRFEVTAPDAAGIPQPVLYLVAAHVDGEDWCISLRLDPSNTVGGVKRAVLRWPVRT